MIDGLDGERYDIETVDDQMLVRLVRDYEQLLYRTAPVIWIDWWLVYCDYSELCDEMWWRHRKGNR